MMKIHKFKEGKPYFKKKDDGSYDLREMYDILFAKVRLYDDPTSEMKQSKNHVKYEDLIRNDKYWINDENLLNKIYLFLSIHLYTLLLLFCFLALYLLNLY